MGGLRQSPEMLLLFWQLAASIDFTTLKKIHQGTVLAHCVGFSMGGTNTLVIHTAKIFSAECKHSARAGCPAALQGRTQQCSIDFTRLAQGRGGGPNLYLN